jgi:hypothetical protein
MQESEPASSTYDESGKTLSREEFEEMLRNHTLILPEEMLPPVNPVPEDY